MKKLIIAEFVVLLLGTLFAWGNFLSELLSWINGRKCETGCIIGLTNPFFTPYFYGALFFTLAFILSAILLAKAMKQSIVV